jgi:hypothetical protein
MTTSDAIYSTPGPMTSPGGYASLLQSLPRELAALTRAIQGLTIHEYMLDKYGVSVPEQRKRESQLRRLDHMLAALAARDPRPLAVPREPAERFIGVCRHFTLLLIAALRTHGVKARARVGFASYFNPPQYEDHWVGEYWNDSQQRWILVDAQLDEPQRKAMKIAFDPLDVPHDQFVIAHDAWTRTRRGEIDEQRFGFSLAGLTGLWFIAGSLIRDAAALNGVELLPWDVWGAMPMPGAVLTPEQLAYFDRLAQLTAAPDVHAGELRALFESGDALKPGATVWNGRAQALEAVDAPPVGVKLT